MAKTPARELPARGAPSKIAAAYAAALALAAALAAAPAAAKEHIVEIDWRSDRSFAHEADVAPGKFVEVCGKLARGDRVAWRFDAGAPVDFNIHYHEGKKAVLPVKHDQTAKSDGVLRVPAAQDYCWMWSNKSETPVRLSLSLRR